MIIQRCTKTELKTFKQTRQITDAIIAHKTFNNLIDTREIMPSSIRSRILRPTIIILNIPKEFNKSIFKRFRFTTNEYSKQRNFLDFCLNTFKYKINTKDIKIKDN